MCNVQLMSYNDLRTSYGSRNDLRVTYRYTGHNLYKHSKVLAYRMDNIRNIYHNVFHQTRYDIFENIYVNVFHFNEQFIFDQ